MQLTPRNRLPYVHSPQGMQLLASRGRRHAQPQFPARAFEVGDEAVEDVLLGPLGRLYSYTVVAAGKAPAYGLAMVDFEPGVRAFGRLILGASRPVLGAQVQVVPLALPDGTDDYAFQMQDCDDGVAA